MANLQFEDNLLIIGNEAADLDSTVSAFALSALLKKINPDKSFFPLIQGSFSDLRLKPEIKELFLKSGISIEPENFTSVFLSQDTHSSKSNSLINAAVIMVDHNQADTKEINFPVRAIVDHHRDSGDYPDLQLRDIRICGSCASIISEYWQKSTETIPYAIAFLLAGAIAVDTGNLKPDWGKTTELDRKQYSYLCKLLKPDDLIFIEDLLKIKNDLSHLNMEDHLRRDYKTFPLETLKGGVSSVTMSQMNFFNPDLYKHTTLLEFIKQRCPDFIIIMHSIPEPFQRELSLYVDKKNQELMYLLKKSLSHLQEAGLIEKSFEVKGSGTNGIYPSGEWTIYNQNNIKLSRKTLVPLLKDELEKFLTEKTNSVGNIQERPHETSHTEY